MPSPKIHDLTNAMRDLMLGPDRAAIEALARSITDAQWDSIRRGHFPGDIPLEWSCDGTLAALLAYLDDVWAGLDELYREALSDPDGLNDTDDPVACAAALAMESSRLAVFRGDAAITPLGRAVLKRARSLSIDEHLDRQDRQREKGE